MRHRFPSPWTAEHIPGGMKDATGPALAYVYALADDDTAKVPTI